MFTEEEGLNWGRAWHWANKQPEVVAEVVREADKFAQLYLTRGKAGQDVLHGLSNDALCQADDNRGNVK